VLGAAVLAQSASPRRFVEADAVRLGAVAPYIAGALRRPLLTEQAPASTTGDGPGVALLDLDGTLRSATPAGARWLNELADPNRPRLQRLSTVVASVVGRLNYAGDGDLGVAQARVLVQSAQWLTVHASRLNDADQSIALVVEPASPVALAPLIVSAYGLTGRQSQVTQRLLTGLARKTIASKLCISLHTVNDHVKAGLRQDRGFERR
jgi:hypothetical protein